MSPEIDESVDDILVFDPSRGKIIFLAGEGRLSKSRKIVASLSQALILFSQRVIDQSLNFVRFQNHRMVFIQEQDLYSVKLVPKNDLAKQFVPPMHLLTRVVHQAYVQKASLVDEYRDDLTKLYNLFRQPEKVLFCVPRSIQGYFSLMVLMAGLTYDLSHRLEPLMPYLKVVGEDHPLTPEDVPGDITGVVLLGAEESLISLHRSDLPVLNLNLEPSSPFKVIYPSLETNYELASTLFGPNTSAAKIAQRINEGSVQEVAEAFLDLPTDDIPLATIRESVEDFPRDKNFAKPMYRILIRRIRELEQEVKQQQPETPALASPPEEDVEPPRNEDGFSTTWAEAEMAESEASVQEVVKEEHGPPVEDSSPPPSFLQPSFVEPKPPATTDSPTPSEVVESPPPSPSTPAFDLEHLADAFTSRLESMADSSPTSLVTEEPMAGEEGEGGEEVGEGPPNTEHATMMGCCRVYVDVTPYVTKELTPVPNYTPLVQIRPPQGHFVEYLVQVLPERHQPFENTLQDLAERLTGEVQSEGAGRFTLKFPQPVFYMSFRNVLWSVMVEYAYAVQLGSRVKTSLFDLPNEGSICLIPDGLTPERRKQLPSQIVDVFEEDKLIEEIEQTTHPLEIARSIDAMLLKLVEPLNYGHSVGLVPRESSQELPLIMEFVLAMSEICGIGWSRW